MRTRHPTEHLRLLSDADAHAAAWSPIDTDVDHAWTEEVVLQLDQATSALRRAASLIGHQNARGRALEAVAARLGPIEACLLDPSTAAACRRSAERITGCSALPGNRLVREAAEALLVRMG